ncbi:BRO1-domain-containing protein [Gonapodya prolifera JEL478]|uniref:BRO domain-containing protein 1 n=1 Tax=Gonapodya prolifera (strain JEL478) TaxID=1344416 RepID=A0A139AWQ5_GONPJ|nr:BRO1-domain-containing protein [Gonapodya prolifera JEL478]|eukprot:KXS21134.1 BRO1-domain-containing protein [Gonapodya prolifera JEL478]
MASQSPMLHIPLKKTEEVDFGPSFRTYIATTYQEDPEKYALEIETLNKLRQDIRGVGKDMTGRDILYRYYGQLELLDLRFPIEEKSVKVVFNWYDAFSSAKVSQHSVAYEKACVIFNLAGVCSAIGAFQNRTAAITESTSASGATSPTVSSSSQGSGLKLAFNYFQCAAGLFQFINDNFLHAPSVDLGRDSIKCLSELMLAQAQETFLEKVLLEKKKGALPSKLAGQCGAMYSEVYDAMNGAVLKQQFDRTWSLLLQVKAKYFQAMAQFHRAIACEAEQKYGERVSRLNLAETLAKEANKLASSFASAYPSFFISTDNSAGAAASVSSGGLSDFFGVTSSGSIPSTATSSSQAILDMTRTLLASVTEMKTLAQKDNDLIYHDVIPSGDSLGPVAKLQAVKPLTFAEVCAGGPTDIPKIVGPDIFAKLVPISVHEASSCYSEEKAKMWRGEEAKAAEADGELQATLASMDINKTLDRLRKLGRPDSGADEYKNLPPEVSEWCEEISSNEGGRAGGESVDEMLGVLEGLKARAREALQGVGLALDDEQRECEGMRMKFMELWTQEPSLRLTSNIRSDIRRHREALEKAHETDVALTRKVSDCKSDLDVLAKSVEEVTRIYVDFITAGDVTAVSGGDSNTEVPVKVGTLLDEDVTMPEKDGALGILGEQLLIERMDSYLSKLKQLKKERAEVVEELKVKLHSDDISPLLLLNKNKEAQLFQSELSKFKAFQVRLQSNIAQQSQLLGEIGNEYSRLKSNSFGMKILEQREKRRSALVGRWQRAWDTWRECRDGLRRGIKFYADLTDLIERTGEEAKDFVRRRAEERNSLSKRLHDDMAERGQRQLKEQLERLKLGSGQSPTTNGSPPLPPPIPNRLPSLAPVISPPSTGDFGSPPNGDAGLPNSPFAPDPYNEPFSPTAPPVSPYPPQASSGQYADSQGIARFLLPASAPPAPSIPSFAHTPHPAPPMADPGGINQPMSNPQAQVRQPQHMLGPWQPHQNYNQQLQSSMPPPPLPPQPQPPPSAAAPSSQFSQQAPSVRPPFQNGLMSPNIPNYPPQNGSGYLSGARVNQFQSAPQPAPQQFYHQQTPSGTLRDPDQSSARFGVPQQPNAPGYGQAPPLPTPPASQPAPPMPTPPPVSPPAFGAPNYNSQPRPQNLPPPQQFQGQPGGAPSPQFQGQPGAPPPQQFQGQPGAPPPQNLYQQYPPQGGRVDGPSQPPYQVPGTTDSQTFGPTMSNPLTGAQGTYPRDMGQHYPPSQQYRPVGPPGPPGPPEPRPNQAPAAPFYPGPPGPGAPSYSGAPGFPPQQPSYPLQQNYPPQQQQQQSYPPQQQQQQNYAPQQNYPPQAQQNYPPQPPQPPQNYAPQPPQNYPPQPQQNYPPSGPQQYQQPPPPVQYGQPQAPPGPVPYPNSGPMGGPNGMPGGQGPPPGQNNNPYGQPMYQQQGPPPIPHKPGTLGGPPPPLPYHSQQQQPQPPAQQMYAGPPPGQQGWTPQDGYPPRPGPGVPGRPPPQATQWGAPY